MKATSITLDRIAEDNLQYIKDFVEDYNNSSVIRYALWITVKWLRDELNE